ncbi:MAG: cyclic pyranopterin phosphate synthase, partial [Francisellaceae bacterium]
AGFQDLGVKKVRLTGGEPTLRRDFIDILSFISSIDTIENVALTTNGYALYKNAKKYREAGLTNITVSLDSLTAKSFQTITQMKSFHKVIAGIEACLDEGFHKVKINAVLLRGMNDTPEELNQFFEYVSDKPVTIRFIELMQTKDNHELYQNNFSSTNLIQDKLKKDGWHNIPKAITDGPALEYSHPDFVGKIGVISPYSNIFCQDCNRVRISSKGELYVCLFDKINIPLRDLLSDSKNKAELINRITSSYQKKKVSHFLHEGDMGRSKHFSSIGG